MKKFGNKSQIVVKWETCRVVQEGTWSAVPALPMQLAVFSAVGLLLLCCAIGGTYWACTFLQLYPQRRTETRFLPWCLVGRLLFG